MSIRWCRLIAVVACLGWAAAGTGAAEGDGAPGPRSQAARLEPCRLPGLEHQALCGSVRRPLDPAEALGSAAGVQIDVHFAVLPALAREKRTDVVFVFAGGPGQSAIELVGSWARLLARVNNRRDIVVVDQRGTGRSAPLVCSKLAATAPLATVLSADVQQQRLDACRAALEKLPHGDLRHYTTWVAMRDIEAVRQALGAPQVNLVGGSYGSRAALEYLRQFPQAVRRVVLDGVVPPDMVLPEAFSTDGQAALEAVWSACEADTMGCARRFPDLRRQWRAVLASLPRRVTLVHPVSGLMESVVLTREAVLGLVRGPLYAPSVAAGLPAAVSEAAGGRFEALVGLASVLGSGRSAAVAEGMHFAVVCSEDVPRMAPGGVGGGGSDFGDLFAEQYRRLCAQWPRGAVPPDFFAVPASAAPALLLSGGADPATPPRHGERVATALRAKARHVVVANAGHGLLALPCMRDVVFRFIGAESDEAAAAVPVDCARDVPRPPAFLPLQAEQTRGAEGMPR